MNCLDIRSAFEDPTDAKVRHPLTLIQYQQRYVSYEIDEAMGHDEQEEELELLRCIFADQLQELSAGHYTISIPLDIPSYRDTGTPSIISLDVQCPPRYPDVEPKLAIVGIEQKELLPLLGASAEEMLLEALQSTIRDHIGSPMIFTLVDSLRDQVAQLIRGRAVASQECTDSSRLLSTADTKPGPHRPITILPENSRKEHTVHPSPVPRRKLVLRIRNNLNSGSSTHNKNVPLTTDSINNGRSDAPRPTCDLCQAVIDSRFRGRLRQERATEYLMSSAECSLCRLLHRAITPNTTRNAWSPRYRRSNQYMPRTVMVNTEKFASSQVNNGHWLRLIPSFSPEIPSVLLPDCPVRCILPLDNKIPASGFPRLCSARVVTPGNINLEIVSKWLSICTQRHQTACHPGPQPDQPLHFRVIDVIRGCVTDAPQACEYTALSYVWGAVNQEDTLTYTSTLRWKAEGTLFKAKLPQTIRDAVTLCEALGQRYLWVDSLCIIQDSGEDKKNQICRMNEIYKHAFLTIVAASGIDSNSGLPGVPGSPQARISQERAFIGSLECAVCPYSVTEKLRKSTWFTRAWTLQENAFSSRTLIFTDELVFFSCAKALWREDIHLESWDMPVFLHEHKYYPIQVRDAFLSKIPKERLFDDVYCPLLVSYIARELSHQKDILNAFAGIIEALSKYMGEFWFGLPIREIETMLSWRQDSDKMRIVSIGVPSWSWAGWSHYLNRDANIYFQRSKHSLLSIFKLRHSSYNHIELIRITRGFYESSNSIHPALQGHFQDADIFFPPYSSHDVFDTFPFISEIKALEIMAFCTSSAVLRLESTQSKPRATNQGHWRYDKQIYNIFGLGKSQKAISQICLKNGWVEQACSRAEFIVITHLGQSHQFKEQLVLMMIEWRYGIAYRVDIADPVTEIDWAGVNPERKLIILG